jgi:hypothetical protein
MLSHRVACVKDAAATSRWRDHLEKQESDMTKRKTVPKTKEQRRIWFEKCDCKKKEQGAHGYFHTSYKGRCPWPTASIETAEPLLKSLAKEAGLTAHEVHEVRAQLHVAGLAEKMGETEGLMLVKQLAGLIGAGLA